MDPKGGFSRRAADPRMAIESTGGGRAAFGGGAALGGRAALAPFAHIAFFYRTASEYAQEVGQFIRAGLAAGEAVMVAVPRRRALLLREELGAYAADVAFADISTVGRNPGRILSSMQAFAQGHSGRPVRYAGEPGWRSRTAAEWPEVARHEVLVNVAFAGQPAKALCPYDAHALGPAVLAEAERNHPALLEAGHVRQNECFAGVKTPEPDDPLPDPPAEAAVLIYRDDPGSARSFVRDRAKAEGLREPRLTDLVIAVGELAANTLRHTDGTGSVRVWVSGPEIICEVQDSGYLGDALAGRLLPAADAGRGHGLWVVQQVCDLVETRTNKSGTTFRLHMALRT
jgi:anti-sigma regulatory factor (Ser/Thr protein kinase)